MLIYPKKCSKSEFCMLLSVSLFHRHDKQRLDFWAFKCAFFLKVQSLNVLENTFATLPQAQNRILVEFWIFLMDLGAIFHG